MSEHGCPALVDLLAEPRDAQVERHLAGCPRCRALLVAPPDPLGALSMDPAALPHVEVTPRLDRPPAEPGTIARFGAEGSEAALTALILSHPGAVLRVAPVSAEVRGATDRDLLLPTELLSYPAIAAIGEAHEIRREQLLGTRAVLDPNLWAWAQRLTTLCRLEEPVPAEAPVGYPVLSEIDPRLRLARARAEARRPFWSEAELLGASESFGALVRHRREALALDPAELEELVEAPGWLERLETDRLDLNGELPVPALAKLMGRLQVKPLGIVMEQLRTAIEARAEGLSAPTRFARRRTAVRRVGSTADPAERQRVADRYLANLTATLKDR